MQAKNTRKGVFYFWLTLVPLSVSGKTTDCYGA